MYHNNIENSYALSQQIDYQKYEALKIERIKQQRQRMENMKDVVEKYTRIICELEQKNDVLSFENQQLKAARFTSYDSKHSDYSILHQKYLKTCEQLSRQINKRQKCEQTIETLRNQLTSTGFQDRDHYICQPYAQVISENQKENYNIKADYQVLFNLYQQLQDQTYMLEKQNISLKEVIRQQSKICYEKEEFWKENGGKSIQSRTKRARKQENGKQNKPGMIKTSSKQNTKQPTNEVSQNDKQSNKKVQMVNLQQTVVPRSTKKQLQLQLKKKEEIIQKFKQSEQQQIQLIEILKSQKSKVCKCHAPSSKHLLSSSKKVAGLVSFKDCKSDFVVQDSEK